MSYRFKCYQYHLDFFSRDSYQNISLREWYLDMDKVDNLDLHITKHCKKRKKSIVNSLGICRSKCLISTCGVTNRYIHLISSEYLQNIGAINKIHFQSQNRLELK